MTLIEALEDAEKRKPLPFNEDFFYQYIRRGMEKASERKVVNKKGETIIKPGTIQQFCKQFNFNRANISNWLNGKKDIQLSVFIRLLRAAKIEMMINQHDIIYNPKNIVQYEFEAEHDPTKRTFKI